MHITLHLVNDRYRDNEPCFKIMDSTHLWLLIKAKNIDKALIELKIT